VCRSGGGGGGGGGEKLHFLLWSFVLCIISCWE
jgi:hypothetical protein